MKLPGSNKTMVEGTFTRIVTGDGKGREEYSFSNFKEVRIVRDEKEFVQRSVPFEILPLYFFRPAIGTIQLLERDEVTPADKQVIDGVAANCVNVRYKEVRRELCFDETTGSLLRQRFGSVLMHAYSNFTEKQGTTYPTTIRVSDAERTWAELQITEVTEEELPASLFEPLPTATVFPLCRSGIGYMKPVDTVKPKYPAWAKAHHLGGRVSIYAVIGRDGKLHDIKVVQSAGKELDDAAVVAVSQWRYEPVNCNGNPIEAETMVSINFN